MRVVLQRVTRAQVIIGDDVVGRIGHGWAILVGVGKADDRATVERVVDKVVKLRAFEDTAGKTNLSAEDVHAEILVISQFTLYADLRRGRRPGFSEAAPPDQAAPLVEYFASLLADRGFTVATGRFGADMDVELINHGPMTIWYSTDDEAHPN